MYGTPYLFLYVILCVIIKEFKMNEHMCAFGNVYTFIQHWFIFMLVYTCHKSNDAEFCRHLQQSVTASWAHSSVAALCVVCECVCMALPSRIDAPGFVGLCDRHFQTRQVFCLGKPIGSSRLALCNFAIYVDAIKLFCCLDWIAGAGGGGLPFWDP